MSVRVDADGWESSEFPVLCETCLGENPYVRMTKKPYGKECKICYRPFTVFTWCPGKNMRYKTTMLCTSCAKLKNLCQICVLDLDLKVGVHTRDKALDLTDPIAKAKINREYFVQNAEKNMAANGGMATMGAFGQLGAPGREAMKKIAASEPYKRLEQNRDDALDQSDRKVIVKPKALEPPSDKNIKSLFLMQVSDDIEEQDIRDVFEQFGELKSIAIARKSKCAFVNFASRLAAEAAALFVEDQGCQIKQARVKVQWAKPKSKSATTVKTGVALPLPGTSKIVYPSQVRDD